MGDIADTLELLSEHGAFGGVQRFYRHRSIAVDRPMKFSVYLPPQAGEGPVPALFFLAGLTCTDETFMIKAGAQRVASRLGIALITPDTSPRETGIAGEADDWDFGTGAGFYLNATEQPWARHFRMHDYIVDELRGLVTAKLPIDADRIGVFGHSMGGHGALVLALRNPELFKSVSAFAPIVAPSDVPWGRKAFTNYLGADRSSWAAWDACALMLNAGTAVFDEILVDQGLADKFLDEQLRPELFQAACDSVGQALTLRQHDGYDHGYYFISTFVEDHLEFHAKRLAR
ncbi:S-formylglutathione hydrolase [soil metagenome]